MDWVFFASLVFIPDSTGIYLHPCHDYENLRENVGVRWDAGFKKD